MSSQPSGRRRRRGRRTSRDEAAPRTPQPAKPRTAKPAKPAGAKPAPAKPAAAKPRAVKPAAATPAPARPKAVRPKPADGAGAPVAAVVKPKAVSDPMIGRTLGRCKIEERIGAGRTAIVYRAHYEALDQVVALKVLQPETAAIPELVERFKSEAQAIAKIDNENVLKIYDVGTEDEHHFMVVELLEGEEILDLIEREGQVEATDALRIVRQAANGLSAAHAKGIIHRDVKPQNLFLLEDGTVKVVDFGLAARFSDSTERVGTPHYMAPETCESGVADLGSDVYSLGIVLYHLLVGQPPYAGKSIQEIMRAHIAAEPLRPERDVRGLDRDVADLVRALTKADPLTRPATADIVPMLDAVGGQALKEKSTLRGRRRRGSRARAAVMRRERQAKRKSSAPIVLAAVGAAAVIGLGIWLLGGDDRSAPPPSTPPARTGSTDGGPESTGPTLRGVVPDSPEVIAARERAKKEAQEAAGEAQREVDAMEALTRAEAKAREIWKSDADTDAVIQHYRSVSRRFKKTEAAKEAKTRIREIKTGDRHPHPDRRYSSEDAVEAARAALEKALPSIDSDIKKHAYDAAKGRVPALINDASGRLGAELKFWHDHTGRLRQFKRSLARAANKLVKKKEPVTLAFDGEDVPLMGASESRFTVRVNHKLLKAPWSKVDAESIATLGALVLGHEDGNLVLQQMAFAFAHELEDAFWNRELELSDPKLRPVAKDYVKRWEARAQGK